MLLCTYVFNGTFSACTQIQMFYVSQYSYSHSVGIAILIILVNVYIIIELQAIPITLKLLMFQVTCPGCLYRSPFYIVWIYSIIQYRSLLDLFNGGKKHLHYNKA